MSSLPLPSEAATTVKLSSTSSNGVTGARVGTPRLVPSETNRKESCKTTRSHDSSASTSSSFSSSSSSTSCGQGSRHFGIRVVLPSIQRRLIQTARFLFPTLPLLLVDLIRLLLAVVVLSPGFVRFAWYYFGVAHPYIVTVQYLSYSCRQRLDVYQPLLTATSSSSSGAHSNTRSPRKSGTQSMTTATNASTKHPVVVFVPGGGWMIGYKLWGALLARSLQAVGRNCTVVMVDYRNYPLAAVPDQLQDVEAALVWTRENIHRYGGDPNNIIVAGESAGGHLAAMVLLRNALQKQQQPSSLANHASEMTTMTTTATTQSTISVNRPSSSLEKTLTSSFLPQDCKGLITISAPYDIGALTRTFGKHGLDGQGVDMVFGGNWKTYDPLSLVQEFCHSRQRDIGGHQPKKNPNTSIVPATMPTILLELPPVVICHGTRDKTVPFQGAKAFYNALQKAGVQDVTFRPYVGWSHTRGNVEGPMEGDYQFHRDVWALVKRTTTSIPNNNSMPSAGNNENDNHNDVEEEKAWQGLGRLCPSVLVKFGSALMPV